MIRVKTASREARLLVPAFVALFVGLGILSVFLLVGESSRARILVEYEADRTASALAETIREEGTLDSVKLDPRIKGFGLYSPRGTPVVRVGNAPDAFDIEHPVRGFRYDRGHGLLTLQRIVGPGGPGMMGRLPGQGFPMMGMHEGMQGGPPFGGAPGMFHGPAGALFLSMDISSYYRSQLLYGTAAIVAPVAVAGLAALFLSLLLSNIRHRRHAQEQETLARLGESARTLAHEIRNPLSAIRIQTGLLRKKMLGSTGPGASAQLDAIDEEVERLSVLSRRVGDFLRNPLGEPGRIVLDQFLSDLVGKLPTPVSYTSRAETQHVAVSFDKDLLRSVVENLIRNAFESYQDGDGAHEVELALLREKTSVVIAVRDRGKGIPPDLLEKVFDPFFTDKVQGSGVGLSLSRRFVEAASGTLVLSARAGGGTEARITLPVRSNQ